MNRIAANMKQCFLFLGVMVVLSGCQNGSAVSTDPQQNRYFRVYQEIYNEWGKIPADSTQQRLGRYLLEFPENADAQMLAGNIAFSMAEYEKAAIFYKKAIKFRPDKALYYSALGTVFNVENRIDSAEKYLLKSISLHDSSAYTFLNVSLLYLKKQESDKCMAFADSAYYRGNNSPIICSGLSYIFSELTDKDRSSHLLVRAKDLGLKDTIGFNEVLERKMKLEDFYRKNYKR